MFGYSVSTHGDVNNDGYDDLVVGAPRHIQNQNNAGRAYVFLGGPSGPGNTANTTLIGTQGGDMFGAVVYICGDVNGDDYDDVLVTAPSHNGSLANEWDIGKAYLYYGEADGVSTTPAWTYTGTDQNDVLGFSGCGINDSNDDTYGDIIVGVPGDNDGTTNDTGAVLLFYGSSSGPSTTPDVTIKGTEEDQLLGYDVAHLGDADVDGLGDFVIGAPHTDNGTWISAGSTQIHYGDPGGVSSDPGVIIYGDASPADYGSSVAPGGDINGDGFDDFVTADLTLGIGNVWLLGAGMRNPVVKLDDDVIWSYAGNFRSSIRIDDFSAALNTYIENHRHEADVGGMLTIHINVTTIGDCKVEIDALTIIMFVLYQPTGLTATSVPEGSAIKLKWDDHTIRGDDISKMAIEYWNGTDWEELIKVPKNAKEYTVSGLTDDVQYQFRILAFDGGVQAYSEPSGIAVATPGDSKAPNKVMNVIGTEDRDAMGINLSWDPSDEDVVNYEIWSNKSGEWAVMTNVSAPMIYMIDSDIEDGPWYFYKIRAWDEVNLMGPFSNIERSRLVDMDGPVTPENFQLFTVPSGRALRLTWDLNDDDTVAYSIESNKTGVWKEVALVGKDVIEFTDTNNLDDGLTYWYRMAARDEVDNPSNYTAKISGVPVDETPPMAPRELTLTARPHGEIIRLAWVLNDDDTVLYNVYMYDESISDFNMVAQVLGMYDQYDVTALVNDVTYRFRLKAEDGSGLESEWSIEATGTPTDTFPPDFPKGLVRNLDPEGGAVNLSWEPNNDDTVAYRILRWDGTLSRWVQLAEVVHPQTWYYLSDLQNNEPYAFAVRAVDEAGNESPNSERVDVIPKDTTAPEPPVFTDLPAVTNSKDVTISGFCQPGAQVTIIINLLRDPETVLCDQDGYFSKNVRLKNGPNEVIAEAVDDSGLMTPSTRYTVRVDINPPEVTITEPEDGAREITRYNLTYEVYFSEEIKSTSIKSFLRKGRLDTGEMFQEVGDPENIISRMIEYDQVRYRATFEVDDVLVGDNPYTILVYDVEDIAGNPIDELLNGHTFQVYTVVGGDGGNGGGGGDDGLGSLGIIAAVIIILLVVVVAFVIVSRSGTHEEIEVDRSVIEAPEFDDGPDVDRPDIQGLYAEAYTERGDEDTEHHEVDGGLGDWLDEQEKASQEAEMEAKRLMDDMKTTDAPQVDTGPIVEVPPDMLTESEYTAAYHMDAPPEAEAEAEVEAEADEDDAAALLDELEEDLESSGEQKED